MMKPGEKPHVVVIGAGVAGLEAALAAAGAGLAVTIVTEAAAPAEDLPAAPGEFDFLAQRAGEHPSIEIITRAEVLSLDGEAPRFSLALRRRREPPLSTGAVELAAAGDLAGALKALEAFNPLVVARRETAADEGTRAHPGVLGRDEAYAAPVTLEAGAVILAERHCEMDASRLSQYGYGRWANVFTRSELDAMLSGRARFVRRSDGERPESVAFVLCAGSRSIRRGERPWCSAVCCGSALRAAGEIIKRWPEMRVTVFHMDIMAVGLECEEHLARLASSPNVNFVRSIPAFLAEWKATGNLCARWADASGAAAGGEFGMAVLSTGIEPSRRLARLAALAGLDLDESGYLAGSSPVEAGGAPRGIFSAGLSGPMGAREASGSGAAAAERAAELLLASRPAALQAEGDGALDADVLVVGGSLAGMVAARALSARGASAVMIDVGKEAHDTPVAGWGCGREALLAFADTLSRWVRADDAGAVLADGCPISHSGAAGHFETVFRTPSGERTVRHKALIIAAGVGAYPPVEYLYGQDERVVTQAEFARELEGGAPAEGTVVMIQCVGSRNEKHPWCSRVCCAEAVANALRAKQLSPAVDVYILHRDVRTFGMTDLDYHEARRLGVRFVRFAAGAPVEVTASDGALEAVVRDVDLGDEVRIAAAHVVLSAGVEPGAEAAWLAEVFRIERGRYGFLSGARQAKVLDIVRKGVYLCSAACAPVAAGEAIDGALAAAGLAADFVVGAGQG